MKNNKISRLRGNIDAIDPQVVRLLNRRAAAAVKIGKIKTESRSEPYVPAREKKAWTFS